MTEELQCIGCGAVIQTNKPGELGYTPQTALEKGLASGKSIVSVVSDYAIIMRSKMSH